MTPERDLSVVVPALEEAGRLPLLLGDLAPLGAEVVVVDGGSADVTRERAEAAGAKVLEAPRGRASQLGAGAAATTRPWLLFLHADSRCTPEARAALRAFLSRAGEGDFAHFRFALDGDRPFWRLLELGQRLRERSTGLVYGDQGLLVSRALFETVGGFPSWPILEDVGILERLGRRGRRHVLDAALLTSPRRYEREGGVRSWLRNVAIIGQYWLGVPPERLAERFPRAPASFPPGRRRRTVVLFAKAPRPGRVKTRLAADLGAEEATRIYRALAEASVDALRGRSVRLVVYHDPPDSAGAEETRAWLGEAGLELRPQRGEDLGARMAHAFDECFAEADEVCIAGTDVPGITMETIADAFAALDAHDVVLGPAEDGGYYLIGLSAPRPDLFRDVPWSTDAVLETTRERAAQIGATTALLEPKRDVDTAPDVPPRLRTA